MSKEKITIIIVSAAGVFVLLVAALFLNSFLGSKNATTKTNSTKSSPAANVSQNNTTAVQPTATSSAAAGSVNQTENTYNRDKLKELITKEIDKSKTTPPKTIADTYKNVDECARLNSDADKNICITLWAEYTGDPSLCVKAADTERQNCQNMGYIAKAIADKDISLCVNIKNSDVKRSCIAGVVAAANLSEKDCTPLPNAENLLCTTYVLIGKAKTLSDCDSIVDPGIKELCRNNFYANTQ